MAYTLSEAAAATGHNRTAIWKAIKKGTLSAHREEATGRWLVEPAELHRLYPPAMPTAMPAIPPGMVGNGRGMAETGELRELRAKLDAADAALRFRDEAIRFRDDAITDLRKRLDTATGQLSEALRLADQRAAPAPIRRWWRFGR